MDVEVAREERKKTITEKYHVATSHKSQRIKRYADEMDNRMIEVIQGLDQPAAQEVLEEENANVLEGGSANER